MKNYIYTLLLAFLCYINAPIQAQSKLTRIYKKVNGIELSIYCNIPNMPMPKEGFPTIIFFFGGGWNGGTVEQFKNQANLLNSLGMVTIRADYRTKRSAGTTPFECVMDAKSVMRYVKKHASDLKVNVHKLVASGGSAGGHLAASTCYIEGFNDTNDDLTIDPRPTALVLFNPVIDNSEHGYGYERVKEHYLEFSPLHNLKNPVPTIFFLGKEDKLIPVSTALLYKNKCEELGGRCDLKLYAGCEHGFFNKIKFNETMDETIKFLISIGYITK